MGGSSALAFDYIPSMCVCQHPPGNVQQLQVFHAAFAAVEAAVTTFAGRKRK
jgi:hypothetical protein